MKRQEKTIKIKLVKINDVYELHVEEADCAGRRKYVDVYRSARVARLEIGQLCDDAVAAGYRLL